MGKRVTLGGDRLGSGKKMQIDLHGYERSTHDLSYVFRTTMAAGTLVPYMKYVALPGDTFDINLGCDVKTHPTAGPLFGSYKVQLDTFLCPIRLYQAQLHNNKLKIGLQMSQVKLPQVRLQANRVIPTIIEDFDWDNAQINPSCIYSYLGIRGVGTNLTGITECYRDFNAVPWLAYWDIYKNYYANKQEEIGAVIHNPNDGVYTQNVSTFVVQPFGGVTYPIALVGTPTPTVPQVSAGTSILVTIVGAITPPEQIMMIDDNGTRIPLTTAMINPIITVVGGGFTIGGMWNNSILGPRAIINYDYIQPWDIVPEPPVVQTFPLENIDTMREEIMAAIMSPTAFLVNDVDLQPYNLVLNRNGIFNNMMFNQEGLAIKTYQSDLLNNWLQTEWIDGTGGINEITAIDTSGGSFSIDTLNLSKKVYDMLNRIAVSDGTYHAWIETVYDIDHVTAAETPMYMGGLIKELVFQEVVSNSASQATGEQPLGTLAGKGVMAGKHKGGSVTIKVSEPSYVMGIVSLTPRLDYSQGNDWDTHLETMDDFHKPALDEIGFEEDINERRAWWSTSATTNGSGNIGNFVQTSAGKQPAWINYMSEVNRVRGNFAIGNSNQVGEMFMILNRRFQKSRLGADIEDLTTYIDPVKWNHIFAQTTRDAQNFWVQISIDATVRRKMSAKLMPNL